MIYITGDCHGGFDRFENDKFSNLTKNDYVIICGDFGGIWDQNKRARYERKRIKQLSKMKFTTLFVDGNHENFDRLYSYPIIEWHGGKVHKINSSIFSFNARGNL
ncbi:MAG: metallophosphoesterase [Bacilli bacterium]|nr:metallophosphoesterase [Bacilli bacterium]